MAEPHSTIAGVAIGAASSLPLLIFGAAVDALILGLLASIIIIFWLDTIDNRAKAASAVLFSALLAGYGSPVAAEIAVSRLPGLAANADSIRLLMAFAIGAITPYAVPLLMRKMGKKIDEVSL